MKVGELREKLAKLKKEELVKIAAEFYKLIPKAKKEDYNVDALVDNPGQKKKKSPAKAQMSLFEIDVAITKFIDDAREQYYVMPNRVVPKKERSTWRFKVKKWYKALINTSRADGDIAIQATSLRKLYELLCESCSYQYFSAYDTFESVGVEQTTFYKSVIDLVHEAEGKTSTVEQCIKLAVDNSLNRYTLYSSLFMELINTYEAPDLKYKAIEVTEKLLKSIKASPLKKKKGYSSWSSGSLDTFRREEKLNNLAELGLRLYLSLFEVEEGVQFYQTYYQDRSDEVKLYVLVRILFGTRHKDQIVIEIEKAIKKGIEPRENLLNLMKEIKQTNELPPYMM